MHENTDAGTGRRVGAHVVVSMDGYSSTGPDDDMSWAMSHIMSSQSEVYYEGIWRGVSTAVMGRTNWEGFSNPRPPPGPARRPTSPAHDPAQTRRTGKPGPAGDGNPWRHSRHQPPGGTS
jgi:dihydrofolate reductase